MNHNGVLDAGEDLNGNNKIEAGNILTVVPETGTASTATTDKNGFALFDVFYPQAYAYWLEVALTAKLTVQGTEFSETTVFVPDGSAADFTSQSTTLRRAWSVRSAATKIARRRRLRTARNDRAH